MKPPVLTLKDYVLSQPIGRGNTSEVRLATGPDQKQVAIKLPLPATLKQHDAAERFGNEVRLTLRFHHPNVVRGHAGTPFGPKLFWPWSTTPTGHSATISRPVYRCKKRCASWPMSLRH